MQSNPIHLSREPYPYPVLTVLLLVLLVLRAMAPALVSRVGIAPRRCLRHSTRAPRRASFSCSCSSSDSYRSHYEQLALDGTGKGVAIDDITARVRAVLKRSGVKEGVCTVCSRHTTTAVTINEFESRLMDDVRLFFNRTVPPVPMQHYLHNDIHLRDCPQVSIFFSSPTSSPHPFRFVSFRFVSFAHPGRA